MSPTAPDLGGYIGSMMRTAELARRQLAAAAEYAYHVTVIPDGGDPTTASFPDAEAAAAHLRGFYGADVHAVVTYGKACPFAGDPPCLVTPEGAFSLHPASDPDAARRAVGFLGRPRPADAIDPESDPDPESEEGQHGLRDEDDDEDDDDSDG